MHCILPPEDALAWMLERIDASGDCWLWQWATGSDGYGVACFQRPDGKWTTTTAHRAVWERLVGPLPEAMHFDHHCRVPSCVNPDHVEPVTIGTNVKRGYGPTAQNARKTHCPYGHPYVQGKLQRVCQECGRQRASATYRQRMAAEGKVVRERVERRRGGQPGVSWQARRGKWEATKTVDGKRVYLGRYATYEEAAEVARRARL